MTDQFNTRYKTSGDNEREFELIGSNALVHSGAFGVGFKGQEVNKSGTIWLIKQALSRDYADQFNSEFKILGQLHAQTSHTPWPVYEANTDSEVSLPALIMPFYSTTLVDTLNGIVLTDPRAAELQLISALI